MASNAEPKAEPQVEPKHVAIANRLTKATVRLYIEKYIVVNFSGLALYLPMLIVGAQYNSEEDCKLEASEYISQYGHSQSEKKGGVCDKYNRNIKVHT